MKIPILRILLLAGCCFWNLSLLANNLVISDFTWEKRRSANSRREVTNDTFRAFVVIPAGHEKNRWMFEAERASGNFAISVNGKKIGECTAPIIRFPLSNLVAGTNVVDFYCSRFYQGLSIVSPKTNPYREKMLSQKNDGIRRNLGFYGPRRFVELADPADIRVAWVETSVREKKITLKAKISSIAQMDAILACEIKDANQQTVLKMAAPQSLEKGEQLVSFEQAWANPKLWDVGQPNLYHAEVKLLSKARVLIDTFTPFRFGFREVWTEGRQVMLNGHPFHMRMEMGWMPLNEKTYGFFQYLGRNTYYIQPHGNCWWGQWGETPELYPEVLDFCDTHGIPVCFPTTGVSHTYDLATTPKLEESYRKNMVEWKDLFRNRPSIIAWGVSMNAYNPKHAIHPEKFGRREPVPRRPTDGWSGKAINIHRATTICKEVDPTRLAYGHGDGAFGDLASANCYPNFTPLQEVIDYPAKWAIDGEMPWAAVEYGVYDGSFFKHGSLLLTEYAAIYFGEKAYEGETQEQLENTIRFGLECRHYGGNMLRDIVKTTDLYWDVMRLYTSGTDKYWRAYNMLGWLHFFGARYGQEAVGGWNKITEPLLADRAPEWATPQVEINRVNMQDLLGFIGGDSAYTDQTHAYYEGEAVRKNGVVVWDGANPTAVMVQWRVKDAKDKVLHQGQSKITAPAGQTTQVPLSWTPPATGNRADYTLELFVSNGKQSQRDSFAFEVFPRVQQNVRLPRQGRVFLYDPQGKSAWVSNYIEKVVPFEAGQHLEKTDVLIVGREALRENQLLPYHMEDIVQGARILVLEQQPTLWAAFGFRLVDMVTRIVYQTPYSKEVMNGLVEKDLRYWRGTPNLIPEYRHVRAVAQPPKGVNRHGVASTVFEIPNVIGFEPLFQCEFDLRYSPLLRFRAGEGAIYYSTFDLTNRMGTDPAATQLGVNLLNLVMKKTAPANKRVVNQFEADADVLVNTGTVDPRTDEFLKKGGLVLNIALTEDALRARGVAFEKKSLYRAKLDGDLAQGATRNMFRWRDALEVNCITEKGAQCEGLWYVRSSGFMSGKEVFLQVGSSLLEDRYHPKTQGTQRHAVMPSVLALDLLKSRVLTMVGAMDDAVYLKRLNTVSTGLPYKTIPTWYAYGPFLVEPNSINEFGQQFPGEEQAIRGDMNPNITYQLKPTDTNYNYRAVLEETKKRTFDFRQQVFSDEEGWVNLTEALKLEGRSSFCYLMYQWEEEKAHEAVFSFTFPTRAVVYLNGERVMTTFRSQAYNPGAVPKEINDMSIRLPLKAGENALTIKLATLPQAWNGIDWPQRMAVTRAVEGISLEDVIGTLKSCTFYNTKGNLNYAYSYNYW